MIMITMETPDLYSLVLRHLSFHFDYFGSHSKRDFLHNPLPGLEHLLWLDKSDTMFWRNFAQSWIKEINAILCKICLCWSQGCSLQGLSIEWISDRCCTAQGYVCYHLARTWCMSWDLTWRHPCSRIHVKPNSKSDQNKQHPFCCFSQLFKFLSFLNLRIVGIQYYVNYISFKYTIFNIFMPYNVITPVIPIITCHLANGITILLTILRLHLFHHLLFLSPLASISLVSVSVSSP